MNKLERDTLRSMKSDIPYSPCCRVCGTELIKLGNSLRDGAYNTVTTYGWCVSCNYFQWSKPWYTHLSSSNIIKYSIQDGDWRKLREQE